MRNTNLVAIPIVLKIASIVSRTQLFLFFLVSISSLSVAQTTTKTIIFEGLEKTKKESLERLLVSKPNAKLDSLSIAKDVQFLNRIPSIAKASYRIQKDTIVFEIEENFTIIPWLEMYQSPNDDLAIGVGIAEFNLLGRNIQLGGYYRHDVFNSFGVQTRASFLFGRNYGLGLGYFNNKTLEPVFFQESEALYSYQNEAFEISGIFQLHQNHQLEIGFRIFSEAYRFLSGEIPNGIPTTLDTDKQNYFTSYIFDDLDYDYYRLDGLKNRLRLDYIHGDDLFNTEDFTMAVNDFRYYKFIGKRGNLASRLVLATATNSGSPFAPFEIDNQRNTRGAGNVIDRGTSQIVLNNEFRYTIHERQETMSNGKKPWLVIQGNAFIDTSTLRRSQENFNALTDANNIRVYSGVGLRFIHKRIFNAIFRIDYGFGVTQDATNGLVFGIGQYF